VRSSRIHVEEQQWRREFGVWKRMRHGFQKIYHAERKPSFANGYIESSIIRMAQFNSLKLDWSSVVIIKLRDSTIMKHLHLWPK